LDRGYAILGTSSKKVITSHKDVSVGDQLSATLKDGILHCTVTKSVNERSSDQ